MPYLLEIPKITDDRGSLSVIEDVLPFQIKRVFYIYDVNGSRGGHRHKKNRMALICINGSCKIFTDNSNKKEEFILDNRSQCLVLEPEDWHSMDDFSDNSVLLVLASHLYNKDDYILEPYR